MSELCLLFICVVLVWMLFTQCNFKFSVSSNFIVISACSSLFTSFRKSISGSRTEHGCDAFFFLVFFLVVSLKLSMRLLPISYFYNHVY